MKVDKIIQITKGEFGFQLMGLSDKGELYAMANENSGWRHVASSPEIQ